MSAGADIAEFVDKLVRSSVLSELSAHRLITAADTTNHPFDAIVTELGVMREEALAKAMAEHLSFRLVEQPTSATDREMAAQLGLSFLKANALVPLHAKDGTTALALADPFDTQAKAMADFAVGSAFETVISTRSAINLALSSIEIDSSNAGEIDTFSVSASNDADIERLKEFARQEPVIRFVTRILQTASDAKATDIHIEPLEHEVRVRMRVDGDLRTLENAPLNFLPGIVTRIKILAGLDISERRLPQDGRMLATLRGQEIDLRVAISPAIHGETIVLRLLDRSHVALDLAGLGFESEAQLKLRNFAKLPNGIVLITGPTGSGKTTTLYAMLSEMNSEDVKIFTVEDPVEYRLEGITQLQINNATGLTFAKALRSILRHDPDIILIGEIRDRETVEIAVQAALTGHLVLATLHTNSALGAVTRLRDMGIDNYLIGATLKGVLAQRLVRRVCGCRHSGANTANCQTCGGAGYSGRTVTYEIAEFEAAVSRLVSENAGEADLSLAFDQKGFKSLGAHVRSLASRHVTSEEEALRISLAARDAQ